MAIQSGGGKMGDIASSFQFLREKVAILDEASAKLNDAIIPILRNLPPSPIEAGVPAPSTVSGNTDVSRTINDITDRVVNITTRVIGALDRIEL